MTLGARARRAGFWSVDLLRGRPIRRQYDDVRSLTEGGGRSDRVLADLLDHASRTAPFYAPYAGGALDTFPVIDRAIVKGRFDELRSAEFLGDDVHYATTSGSTGTPLRVAHDLAKRRRLIADVIYFNELAGQRLGDPMMYLRSWRGRVKPRRARLIQNIVPVEAGGLDGPAMASAVRILRSRKVTSILGYASALEAIGRHLEQGGQRGDFGLRVIISGAETLQPHVKDLIEAAFGCPVVDRYANEENGVLASTRLGDDRFHLNYASYRFEFLRPDADEPAPVGSLARVVVTDLHNRAMPMIRYDTGDLAVLAEVDDRGEPRVMRRLDGRRSDVIYDTSGGLQSVTMVAYLFRRYFEDIARYQLIQEGATTYRLLVCLGSATYTQADFVQPLVEMLGPDADVIVEFRDEIPTEPNAKFRPLVRRYDPPGSAPAGRREQP